MIEADQTSTMSGHDLVLANDANEAFVSGLQNLDAVVDVLGAVKSGNTLSAREAEKTIKQLTPLVHHAYENLTKSLRHWEGENNLASAKLEATVREIGQTKHNLSQQTQNAESLSKKIQSLSDEISNKERELGDARQSLSRANDSYHDAEEELEKKRRDQAIVAGVGAGVLAIPIFGWVAGATMLAVSFTALEDAVKNARENRNSAEENVRACENSVSEKKSQQYATQQQHSQETTRLRGTEQELRNLEARKRDLEAEQKRYVELAEKLKNTCLFMKTLWGRSSVLKTGVDFHAYTLEPLFRPLKEIAGMFTFNEQIKLKMNTLLSKSIDYNILSSKMLAICEKTQDKSLAILDDYI